MTTVSENVVEAAAALGPLLRELSAEHERERRLSAAAIDALRGAGIFRMGIPRALGGLESDPLTTLRVIEELAVADGATGWCANIYLGTSTTSGLIAADAARAMFPPGADTIIAGAFAPKGRAEIVEGGYRVSGRWPFASGCEHCDWLVGGCTVFEGEKPRMLRESVPDMQLLIFPRADAEIIDTWDVAGLRGTGSHDIAVRDLVVPRERAVPLSSMNDARGQHGPLYTFPTIGLLAAQVASVPLGIARRAIDELVALASEKTPVGASSTLVRRPLTHDKVARAEAELRSGRAFLFETVSEVWDHVVAGDKATLRQRAMLRLASAHATTAAVRATDLAYDLGGGTSLYASSALQRQFRDVHAVTQHILASDSNYEWMGRVLLGLDPAGIL